MLACLDEEYEAGERKARERKRRTPVSRVDTIILDIGFSCHWVDNDNQLIRLNRPTNDQSRANREKFFL